MPSQRVAVVLVLISTIFFCIIGQNLYFDWLATGVFGAMGACAGLVSFWILRSLASKLEPLQILTAFGSCSIGALLGVLVLVAVTAVIDQRSITIPLFGYLALILTGYSFFWGWQSYARLMVSKGEDTARSEDQASILDTSVIIDGRIADICDTGFINRQLIIPQFVLKELQMIADSPDVTKRTRGRRGLDILNKIQKQSSVQITIDNTDYAGVREVDQKLINLAKDKGYSILTNDFNLNKVAEVHAVPVLNINQLANALKPIVLPGETMKVQIVKEGKEPTQGVAYLDDGTMVVVEQGRKYMGKTIEAVVTSVLQTTAGRMIFAATKAS